MPEQFNKSQYEAVHFAEGALLLLAGPGSGKTFVITHRIKYLITDLGVPPEKILVITFTKAAAIEMKERFKKLTGISKDVVFGTFHAVFYQILRTLPEYQNLSLISETEKLKMINEILHQMHEERYTRDQSYTGVLRQLSKYKNDPGAAYEMMEDLMEPKVFARFRRHYQTMLMELGKLDFDDMVLLCYKALKEKAALLAYWQDRFDYLLIDEFQDINILQYEVIKLLAGKKNNLFVVGDDDQSIYGFRGASPGIMQRFLREFNGAVQICLAHNYRSREEIVEAAEQIIKENRDRFQKETAAVRGTGGKPFLILSDSTEQEMQKMTEHILAVLKEGIPEHEIAVLARTNRELHAIVPYLDSAGISCAGGGRSEDLLEQEYSKAILAYFAYLAGDRSRENFYRFMNRPLRYIKRDAVPEGVVTEKAMLGYYRGNYRMQDTVKTLFAHLNRMEHMKPALALHYIRKVAGLDLYVKEHEREDVFVRYTETCDTLKSILKKYDTVDDVQRAVREKTLIPHAEKDAGGIRLMTYHASKGLEFTAVFLPELIDGRVPPRQAKTLPQVEEERRMFYVAVTRAKDRLYLYAVVNQKEEASRFLRPLLRKELYSSSPSINSSNSTESKNSSNASETASYSSSSSM